MRKLIFLIVAILLVVSLSVPAGATVKLTALSGVGAEPKIITEAVILLLEENLDVTIDHKQNFTADLIMHNAMIFGESDLYCSYTGTQFAGVLGMEVTEEWKDREKVFQYVKEQFDEKFGITWMEPFGFNNTYTLAVSRGVAEKHNLETISDLQGISDTMTLGMAAIFRERPGDGYQAMNESYGLSWRRPIGMDYGLLYRAVASGDVDVVVGHSTDGRMGALDLVMLEDDRSFFPPYDCALVVPSKLLEQFPEIPKIVAPLIGKIDDAMMGYYNRLVDVEHQEPADVARLLVDELTK